VATFTFQTFQQAQQEGRLTDFLWDFIQQHKSSPQVAGRTGALAADLYDRQKNPGAEQFAAAYAEMLKRATNNTRDIMRPDMVKSNLFRRLNKQRAAYSLGNGVTFADGTDKLKLGSTFDEQVFKAGYFALIHGESFGFWNNDHLVVFKLTEFAPLYDEKTGLLQAGVRFWRLNPDTDMHCILYELDGFTEYTESKIGNVMQETTPKQAYKSVTVTTPGGGLESVEGENYSALPIVPLWGSDLHQSTLVGLKAYIDNTDLVMSGFCNDLQDCAQIYWLCENFGGMTQDELQGFLQQLNLYHVANADTSDGGKVQPYTTEIPVTARSTLLDLLHSRSYEDFGGLDVHCVSADSTNDHLDAAYEPLNHNADDFEAQLTPFIQQICKLAGLGDVSPIFTRSKITNTAEQVSMVISEAPIIGQDMAIDLLPNLTPEQKEQAKAALMAESAIRETVDEEEGAKNET
jgi:hypothetical protein